MGRILGLLVVAGLVLAPAASAKGPHAVLYGGSQAVEPGKTWVANVVLNELPGDVPGDPKPLLVARRGHRMIVARPRSRARATEYELRMGFRMVFPTAGRWRLELTERKRRFVFPAVRVGSGREVLDWIAFPKGSEADRAGGGGQMIDSSPEPAGSGRAEPLEPRTVSYADDAGDTEEGGIPLWLPLAGLVLLGAGAATLRGRRSGGRPGSAG
jgi:hypothetical protein